MKADGVSPESATFNTMKMHYNHINNETITKLLKQFVFIISSHSELQ